MILLSQKNWEADMADAMESITHNGFRYEWLGQSTMRITAPSGFVIYTDPVMLDSGAPEAGLILITHHHVDHCLPEFVVPLRGAGTKIGAFHESYIKHCVQEIKGARTIKVGQTITLGPAIVTGVEAYAARGFHMKGEGCGFLIEIEGQRIYFAGDTQRIPEMDALGKIDVAILPIADNIHSIDAADMARAAVAMGATLFVPVHFTPGGEGEPEIKEGEFFSKDPRFFTSPADPATLAPLFEGTKTKIALLKKLGSRAAE